MAAATIKIINCHNKDCIEKATHYVVITYGWELVGLFCEKHAKETEDEINK